MKKIPGPLAPPYEIMMFVLIFDDWSVYKDVDKMLKDMIAMLLNCLY